MEKETYDIEEAVIHAMLLDHNALLDCLVVLKKDDFESPIYGKFFGIIQGLWQEGITIDETVLKSQLHENLVTIYDERIKWHPSNPKNYKVYIDLLKNSSNLRQLVNIGYTIQSESQQSNADYRDILCRAEQNLIEFSQSNESGEFETPATLLPIVEKRMQQRKGEELVGITSGIKGLDALTSGFQNQDFIIIGGRPGLGKCLGKGTKALMYNGSLKNVEDIKVNDKLMGPDSTPRKVLSTTTGISDMYIVEQKKGINYICTENHILSLKRSRGGKKGAKTHKVKHGDILNISIKDFLKKSTKFKSNYKGYITDVDFPEKKLPIDPYFLGLWLGDGCKENTSITSHDQEIIDYIYQYASQIGLQVTNYEDSYSITKYHNIGSQKQFTLKGALKQLNLIDNKHIPKDYLINSKENRLLLLAGLIDSDGYKSGNKNGRGATCYGICLKNKNLLKQVKFLCNTLGYKAQINEKLATIKKINFSCIVYRLNICGNINEIPLKVIRKKIIKPTKIRCDIQITGINIKHYKKDNYYGFELDKDGLFCLEDMTITHNSSLVEHITLSNVIKKIPVAYFSFEMSKYAIIERAIANLSEIDSWRIRAGNLNSTEWGKFEYYKNSLLNLPIHIQDTSGLSIIELQLKTKRLKLQLPNLGLIVVDYLQLMSGGGVGREQEISSISRGLKAIAKDLNIPVIAVSQLSRKCEEREDKRPLLSDLRESGAIEQDADLVILMYRDYYYTGNEDHKFDCELNLAKHRNGPSGLINCYYHFQYQKFYDVSDKASIK